MSEDDPCPCGRPGTLAACCGPYLAGLLHAPDPESLMRSRYTAFALGTREAAQYLFATHHPDFRSPNLREELQASQASVDAWLKLEVISAQADGDRGEVHFVAKYRVNGQPKELREYSQFQRVQGRWLYTEGALR